MRSLDQRRCYLQHLTIDVETRVQFQCKNIAADVEYERNCRIEQTVSYHVE